MHSLNQGRLEFSHQDYDCIPRGAPNTLETFPSLYLHLGAEKAAPMAGNSLLTKVMENLLPRYSSLLQRKIISILFTISLP